MATTAGGQPGQLAPEGPDTSRVDDIANLRKGLSAMEDQGNAALPPLSSSLEEFYTDITTSDGWTSKCKVVKPKATSSSDDSQTHPLIVYFYGGGFMSGSPGQVTRPAREWAEQHNATVICPSYRLAPEHPWPQGVKDGWDIVSYLARHAETDPRFGNVNLGDGFVIGGVSAGGGVAGVIGGIALLTESDPSCKLTPPVEKLAAPLTGLFIAIAVLAHETMIPPAYKHLFTAWEDNRHHASLDTAGVMGIFDRLQCTDYKSPWFSPINVLERALPDPSTDSNTPVLTITRHPRTYIQSCAKDPLRDDTLVLDRMLRDLGLGTQTQLDLFPDDGHAAWTALPFESESKNPTIREGCLNGMTWLLEAT